MCTEDQACLTRVVGDQCDMQVTRVQDVMHKIQASLHGIPASHRDYIANALLNLAVSTMMQTDDSTRTSSILLRFGDGVATSDSAPPASHAIDLTVRHS